LTFSTIFVGVRPLPDEQLARLRLAGRQHLDLGAADVDYQDFGRFGFRDGLAVRVRGLRRGAALGSS